MFLGGCCGGSWKLAPYTSGLRSIFCSLVSLKLEAGTKLGKPAVINRVLAILVIQVMFGFLDCY